MKPLNGRSQRYPRLAGILEKLSAAKGMDRHERYVRACGFLDGLCAAGVFTPSELTALNVSLCNVLIGLVSEGV